MLTPIRNRRGKLRFSRLLPSSNWASHFSSFSLRSLICKMEGTQQGGTFKASSMSYLNINNFNLAAFKYEMTGRRCGLKRLPKNQTRNKIFLVLIYWRSHIKIQFSHFSGNPRKIRQHKTQVPRWPRPAVAKQCCAPCDRTYLVLRFATISTLCLTHVTCPTLSEWPMPYRQETSPLFIHSTDKWAMHWVRCCKRKKKN